MLFKIKVIIISVIILQFIGLSTKAEATLGQSQTKAGKYSWDSDHTCGLVDRTESRIRDGVEAELSEFPWMAALFVSWDIHHSLDPNMTEALENNTEAQKYFFSPGTEFSCGAAIISDYWLITAKHCVRKLHEINCKSLDIYVGSISKKESYMNKKYRVVDYIMLDDNDIALLRVMTKIERHFDEKKYRINRICIPEYNNQDFQKEKAVLSGFGQMGLKQESLVLRKANFTTGKCEYLFRNNTICGFNDRYTSCEGDSGSSLIRFDGNRAVIIGTVELHGPDTNICENQQGGFVQFARVAPYAQWIKNIVESDKPQDWTPKLSQNNGTPKACLNWSEWDITTSGHTSKKPKDSTISSPITENPLETTTSGHPLTDNIISRIISLVLVVINFINLFRV